MTNQLYNLQSKRKMSKILLLDKIGAGIFDYSFINKYNVFVMSSFDKNGVEKKRLVEAPSEKLRFVQDRLFKFMKSIELTTYLISKTGKSYIDNHKIHKGNSYIVSMDIKKFFPNCTFNKVFDFLREKMQMSEDVSTIISRILTIDYSTLKLDTNVINYLNDLEVTSNIKFPTSHIPTGSTISTLLSFLSYQDMFDLIYNLSSSSNIRMTVYVDDMTFSSSSPIPRSFVTKVNRIIRKYGHKINPTKRKYLSINDAKNVTGVIINKNDETCIPNKLHFKYSKSKKSLTTSPDQKDLQRHKGIQNAMKLIEKASTNTE